MSEKATYTNCTLSGLTDWLKSHPDITIITDVKENNIRALTLIAASIPDAGKRVIPQIYQPENFPKIKALGFQRIIWTLYRYPGKENDVIRWLSSMHGSLAVTMPPSLAKRGLSKKLSSLGIKNYVHTINDPAEYRVLNSVYSVSEIYTDTLTP